MDHSQYVKTYKLPSEMAGHRLLSLVILSFTVCAYVQADTKVLLADGQKTARHVPHTLGRLPFQCAGNLTTCDNGFTLSFWFRTPAQPDNSVPNNYVISSGAQSPLSDGIYVRQNYGKDYEVSVGFRDRQWTVEHMYLQPDTSTWLAAVWSETGLAVHIDGLLAGSDVTGSSRLYFQDELDPFPDLVIGGDSSAIWKGLTSSLAIDDVIHWDQSFVEEDLPKQTGPVDGYVVGCVDTMPIDDVSGATQNTMAENTASASACRRLCADQKKKVALLQINAECVCWDSPWTGDSPVATPCQTVWSAYSTTSVDKGKTYPITLTVNKIMPSEEAYIRVDETLVFELATDSDENVLYYIDFGDGQSLKTPLTSIGHSWSVNKTYTVNITATNRLSTTSTLERVMIQWVDEGLAPEDVDVKAETIEPSRKVNIFSQAFSNSPTHCNLEYGDGNQRSIPEKSDIITSEYEHTYTTIGFYDVLLDCKNKFGTTRSSQTAIAAHSVVDYESLPNYEDIRIPLVDGNDPLNKLAVFIDGLKVNTSVTDQVVKLQQSLFQFEGQHVISLQRETDETVLRTKVYNIEEEVMAAQVLTQSSAVELHEEVQFSFNITSGNFLNVYIDYGDGEQEYWYFPSTPPVLINSHKYAELGKYTVTLVAANSISHQSNTAEVFIERPLQSADLYHTQVKLIGQPTFFSIELDLDATPAMPVEVEFEYGDGITETVQLGDKQPLPVLLNHSHIYRDYGLYHVYGTVSNHISTLYTYNHVQVGEDIELVDLYVKENTVTTQKPVEFTIYCPQGMPLKFEMNMGNEEVIVIEWPHGNMTLMSKDDMLNDVDENGSGEADISVVRRKRSSVLLNEDGVLEDDFSGEDADEGSGDDDTFIVVPIVTAPPVDLSHITLVKSQHPHSHLPPNDVFLVNYTYSAGGIYTVHLKASNVFNAEETFLCPDISVAVAEDPVTKCADLEVAIAESGTEDKPLVVTRSEMLELNANSVVNCNKGTNMKPLYSWTTKRQIGDEWRPELEVCETNRELTNITIPSNTLWYGNYTITATVAMMSDENGGARKKRATQENIPTLLKAESAPMHLKVVPSDLVASIKHGDFQDVVKTEPIEIDMTPSFDPDVDSNNKTGMQLYLFCYGKKDREYLEKRSLDFLLQRSTKITTSSDNSSSIYEVSDCFKTYRKVWMLQHRATVPGEDVFGNHSLVFDLFITKDDRESRTWQEITVWPGNFSSDALLNIDALLASGNTDGAIMVLDLVTGSLDGDGEANDTAQSDTRTLIIGAADKVVGKIDNSDQAKKITGVLSDVTKVTTQLTSDSKASAAGVADKSAGVMNDLANGTALSDLEDIGGNVLTTLGNVLPKIEKPAVEDMIMTTMVPETTTAEQYMTTAVMEGTAGSQADQIVLIPCCEEFVGLCEWIEPSVDMDYIYICRPDAANEGCLFMDEGESVDFKTTVWDEKTCSTEHPDNLRDFTYPQFQCWENLVKERKYAKEKQTTSSGMGGVGKISQSLQKKEIDSKGVSLGSPEMQLVVAKLGPQDKKGSKCFGGFNVPESIAVGEGAGVQMLEMTDNPFIYTDGAKPSTAIKSLSFASGDGEEVSVNGTAEPIIISMETNAAQRYNAMVDFPWVKNWNYHHLEVTDENTTFILYLESEFENDNFTVVLKMDNYPNETYYDWKVKLPEEERLNNTDMPDHWKYMVIVPPEVTSEKNVTYWVGVARYANDTKDSTRNSSYSFANFPTTCRYWNEHTDAWDTSGCETHVNSTLNESLCSCNHLTSFGGDFAVPVNTINFATVFSAEKFLESMPVFCTIIIVIGFYITLLVWGRHMDKKDVLKWGATPLEDNLPTDTYHYQFTVNTGVKRNSGTQSRISFILSGDTADTGVRRLYDGKRKESPSGSVYNYLLSTEQSLGPLTYLRIWHDNSGKGKKKGWFLDQVQITDLQTGDKFFFLCDRWLAVEEDDGMVERMMPVAGTGDLSAFKHLFNSSVRKKMTNDHMWVSVFSRPTKSNFTRVQRISCCVSLLFLTMITNCMFFKADEGVEKVSSLKVGPFSFTLHQLFISIVTTLIVFPPSIAVVTIFRKARQKKNPVMQMNQHLSKKSNKHKWRSVSSGSALWQNNERSRLQKMKDSIHNIMTAHQRAKYKPEADKVRPSGQPEKKKKKGWSLPHWTVYIAWTLVFFIVTASGFFTILYSMEWGREKSVEWLSTFLLSFMQSVVVVQPVKVLLLAAFISCVMRKPDFDEEEESFDDANAATSSRDAELLGNSQRDLHELIEARKIAASQVAPPDMEALNKARDHRLKELQMEAILKECIVYFFFIIVLFFLSYQTRDRQSFNFANNIKNTFVHSSPSFESANSNPNFWKWVHGTLLPNMYNQEWYNGKGLDWRESLQIEDMKTIRVGVARIRQLRIREESCAVQGAFETLIHHCRDNYNWRDDDTDDYLPGWSKPSNDDEKERAEMCHEKQSPWSYRTSVELKNAPYSGQQTSYKGGGYTFTFKRTLQRTQSVLEVLEKQEWLDVLTRGVFVEFTLYNANANLFGSVIMLMEQLATGGSIAKAEVKVFRLSSYVGGFGIIVIFFEVCYLCFTIYFLIKMIRDLVKQRLKYFQNFWQLLEFSTVVLSLVAIVMYVMKKIFGTVAIKVLEDSGSADYVNFVTISIWDDLFNTILACAVFISTIKFIKMLKFNRRMSMLGDTIRVATKDLKNFCIVFIVYWMAFCMTAYILFGKLLPSYGTFVGTMEALFAFALGDFDFYAFQDSERILGPAFFFMYVLVIYIGLMGMFLTIIYDAFAEVKRNTALQSNEYEIVDFMWKKLRGVFGWS